MKVALNFANNTTSQAIEVCGAAELTRKRSPQRTRSSDISANAALRAAVRDSLASGRGELALIAGLAAISLIGFASAIAPSLNLVAHWSDFAQLVRTLVL